MTRSIATDLFGTIHVVGIALLVAMLFKSKLRERFEQRCVGTATAQDLAWIRIVCCVVTIIYVLSEDLTSLARFDGSWYDWPGYLIHLGREKLIFFVESEGHLAAVTGLLLATLALGALGLGTRFIIPAATILYILYAALLRSFGKYFHDGYLVMYLLLVLSFLPSGDAWSLDAWLRNRRHRTGQPPAPRTAAYNWMVWACFASLCIPYLQLATSKWYAGGLFWWDGRSLRNYMLVDDLNITEWNIDLALSAMNIPTFLWWIAGLFALLAETLYPFVLISHRIRRYLPLSIGLLHLGVWFGQDAVFIDAILMPLAFLLPSKRFAWSPSVVAHAPPTGTRLQRVRSRLRGPVIPIVLVALMLFADHITYRVSFRYGWPLEGWQMYSGKTNRDPAVHYRRFVARYPDGSHEQVGLGECAKFLVKPYRLDFGLSRNLPRFLSICLLRYERATELVYETRTWKYFEITQDQHLAEPPDYAMRVVRLPRPPSDLRARQPATQLLQNPGFEALHAATAIPDHWVTPKNAFTGIGLDAESSPTAPSNLVVHNHAFLVQRVPVKTGESPPQSVRQTIDVPAGERRTLTVSVLALANSPGSELAVEADGSATVKVAIPADGRWHRVEVAAPLATATAGKATVVLTSIGDTYFDDAAATIATGTSTRE